MAMDPRVQNAVHYPAGQDRYPLSKRPRQGTASMTTITAPEIVKRLRDHKGSRHPGGCADCYAWIMDEAADFIEAASKTPSSEVVADLAGLLRSGSPRLHDAAVRKQIADVLQNLFATRDALAKHDGDAIACLDSYSHENQRFHDRIERLETELREEKERAELWKEATGPIHAARNKAIEECAKVVDQCNHEGPYNAIGAASRIRALKMKDQDP
jgi:hypothetical protein